MNKYTLTAAALLAATAVWLYDSQPAPVAAPAKDTILQEPASPPSLSAIEETGAIPGVGVREDRNCRVELKDYVTRDGEMFSAFSCTPFELPPPHPYEHYTDDTLESLAYADAQAAALLGQRLAGQNHEKSYQMLVRAAALDGDTRHLAWLGDVSFGAYRRGGELQIDTVKRRYELAALAAWLGEDPEFSLFLRDELLAAGVASDQVDQLDERVQELLETVRGIQLNVYGEVRHGGQNDA